MEKKKYLTRQEAIDAGHDIWGLQPISEKGWKEFEELQKESFKIWHDNKDKNNWKLIKPNNDE